MQVQNLDQKLVLLHYIYYDVKQMSSLVYAKNFFFYSFTLVYIRLDSSTIV